MTGRIIAVVPAHNEEGAIAGVVGEILASDPRLDVVVVRVNAAPRQHQRG